MNPTEIERAIRDLVAKQYDPVAFPYDLIAIHNASKVTVSKLKSGQTNGATQHGDVVWKNKLFFRAALSGADLGAVVETMAADPLLKKQKPRLILTTDGEQVYGRDLKTGDTINEQYCKLDEQVDFLLPLADYERREAVEEHPADIKAAKKLKKLYDAILAANTTWSSGHHTHELNLLMTRLLFCFYAEKTGIFDTPKIFTNTLTQYTQEDGADVASLLDRLFRIMNVEPPKRPASTPAVEAKFPYVNGSLFEDTVEIPTFSRTARRQMLECGDLDWTTINPDIFGSMIQTISQDGTRSDLGMHYTSVPNIMKVLQPLLLDDLHECYDKAKDSVAKLEALLDRLSRIRIFDPACGSGNFLVIAYKALRSLEIDILKRICDISVTQPLQMPRISIENFYGIDLVDFACETAKLSLWVAEHQMNMAFRDIFGKARPTLPLGKITSIHNRNALRLDWFSVCPAGDGMEIYVCGNPPYQGVNGQTPEQKADTALVVGPILRGDTKVDYVGCWLVKLTDYIAGADNARGAIVATNSICQGEQVAFLWPYVFLRGLCIAFAHTSFKWSNNASNNAGVTCVIVGLSKPPCERRRLYTDSHERVVPNINPYLIPSQHNVAITKRKEPLSALPPISKGNEAFDGGHLMLSDAEAQRLLQQYPAAKPFVRRIYGSREFIYDLKRYVLWIPDENLDAANAIEPIAERLRRTREWRKTGGQHSQRTVGTPHRFAFIKHQESEALVIPELSSERRRYLQIGLLRPADIASNRLYVAYSPPLHALAILSSRLHRIWAEMAGGKLEERVAYSLGLVYNTFPIPTLSHEQQMVLADCSKAILRARAKHPGKTIAWLYNPETMPANLLEAHRENDAYLEEHVYGRLFRDDTNRLEHLFAMYVGATSKDQMPLFSKLQKHKKAG